MKSEDPHTPKQGIHGDAHTVEHNGLHIDVYKLIHLVQGIAPQSVPVSDFAFELSSPCWDDADQKRVSPQDVIDAYHELGGAPAVLTKRPALAKHVHKIENADVSFPILVYEGHIIDGTHRFVKTILADKTEIQARILGEIPEKALIPRGK